jgi:hypothetical protein
MGYLGRKMGFALWIRGEEAIAQGTHEYRPMGVAVIGARGVFTPRDFRHTRRGLSRMDPSLAGYFASLGEMNDYLKNRFARGGRSHAFEKKRRILAKHGPSIF